MVQATTASFISGLSHTNVGMTPKAAATAFTACECTDYYAYPYLLIQTFTRPWSGPDNLALALFLASHYRSSTKPAPTSLLPNLMWRT